MTHLNDLLASRRTTLPPVPAIIESVDAPLLQLADVGREYSTPAGPLKVLSGISLTLHRGESRAITGPSGSGKTTLLNIIASLDAPTAGTVTVEGTIVHSLSAQKLQAYRARQIGLVFQDHRLFPHLSAIENVLVPTLAPDCRENQERAPELLELMGLSARASSFAWQLSGGERQRVAIARAMINGASLLLCDEPTGNLDHQNAASVSDLLIGLAATRNIGIIIVTHNLELAARCSKQLALRDGRVLAEA